MSGCCGPTSVELAPSPSAARPAELPIVVTGAGPVGLAAAAHLAERGLEFLVLEAGERVGASVARWGHVRVFSPWKYDIDAAARRLLKAAGWSEPDPEWLPTGAELRLDLDPVLGSTRALAPLIDPNHHSCGTVPPHGADELGHPEPGYYAIGVKSYGRAPTFLMATGYEQARSVAAALAGDWAAARDVRLELPETGVCSSTLAEAQERRVGLATGLAGGLSAASPLLTGGAAASR